MTSKYRQFLHRKKNIRNAHDSLAESEKELIQTRRLKLRTAMQERSLARTASLGTRRTVGNPGSRSSTHLLYSRKRRTTQPKATRLEALEFKEQREKINDLDVWITAGFKGPDGHGKNQQEPSNGLESAPS